MNFETAIDRLFSSTHEGVAYVNDPNDPGGETKFGISKRSYPSVDIRNLTREAAAAIYRTDFWNPVDKLQLPRSITYQLFDMSVNSGAGNAVRCLQRAVNVADDGYWGPHSAAKANTLPAIEVGIAFLAERLAFCTKLKAWPSQGRGWTIRNTVNLGFLVIDCREEKL